MEKIYEKDDFEESNYNYKKKSNLNFSVISSFAVSLVAIFALIICGFNEISYAAPESIPEKLTFYHYKRGGEDVSLIAVSNGDFIQTPLFFSDASFTKSLFCVEHTVEPSDDGAELSLINSDPSKGSNSDAGISYIIENSFIRGKNMLPDSTRDAEAFATQMAIWAYLYNKYPDDPKHAFTESQLNALVNATTIQYRTATDYEDLYTASDSIYKSYIEPIVLEALNTSFTRHILVSRTKEGITKVEDGKYYQTPLNTVTGIPNNEFISFDLEFKGIEGAFAVNKDGQKIESLSNIPKGTEFYIRVPVENVTESLQDLRIIVSGHFDTFLTNDYAEEGKQKVISIDDTTRIFVSGIDYGMVGAPDTGMSKAQTIYFIGLIVLLCGVGIVYANAKPIENN